MPRGRTRRVRREWTAQDERELKRHLKNRTPVTKNFQGAEAYCWRSKTEGTSFRNRDRAQTTTQKAFSSALT
jgi:hypothetical protein